MRYFIPLYYPLIFDKQFFDWQSNFKVSRSLHTVGLFFVTNHQNLRCSHALSVDLEIALISNFVIIYKKGGC